MRGGRAHEGWEARRKGTPSRPLQLLPQPDLYARLTYLSVPIMLGVPRSRAGPAAEAHNRAQPLGATYCRTGRVRLCMHMCMCMHMFIKSKVGFGFVIRIIQLVNYIYAYLYARSAARVMKCLTKINSHAFKTIKK